MRRLHIVGETFVDVNHCLIAAKGATKLDIRRVISHPQVNTCPLSQQLSSRGTGVAVGHSVVSAPWIWACSNLIPNT